MDDHKALEAAERKPVIDREALAKFIRDDAAYNYATILSDGEALALAGDILRFMSVEDKREAQAEALEAFAARCDSDWGEFSYIDASGLIGYATVPEIASECATAIREGRA